MLLTEMYNRAPVSQQLFDVSSVHIAYCIYSVGINHNFTVSIYYGLIQYFVKLPSEYKVGSIMRLQYAQRS